MANDNKSDRIKVGKPRPSFWETLGASGRSTASNDPFVLRGLWSNSGYQAPAAALSGASGPSTPGTLTEALNQMFNQELSREEKLALIDSFIEQRDAAFRDRVGPLQPVGRVGPSIDDTLALFDARLAALRQMPNEVLTQEELMEDPRYLELTRALQDINDRIAQLEGGISTVNRSAAESRARTAGLASQTGAAIGGIADAAAGEIAAATGEAQAGIREAYDIATANLDQVLEVAGADQFTSAAVSGEVNALADEFINQAAQQGASATAVTEAAGELGSAIAQQMGAANDADREEIRALTVLGLQENIRVAAQQRQRVEEDRDRLEKALQDEAAARRLESLALNVPLTAEGFAGATILGDWLNAVGESLGMELTEEEQNILYQEFHRRGLAQLVNDPKEFDLAVRPMMAELFLAPLERRFQAGEAPISADKLSPFVRFSPTTGLSIDVNAIRKHYEQSFDSSDDALGKWAEATKGIKFTEWMKLDAATKERYRKEALDDHINAQLGDLDQIQSLLTPEIKKEAMNTYRIFLSMRERYKEATDARSKWISDQKAFPGGGQALATVIAEAAVRAGFPNPEDLALSPALHQLVSTLNPTGKTANTDNTGIGIFNLPSTVYAQFGGHLGTPNKLTPVEQAEAFLLYLNAKYGGSPAAALQHLLEHGRI